MSISKLWWKVKKLQAGKTHRLRKRRRFTRPINCWPGTRPRTSLRTSARRSSLSSKVIRVWWINSLFAKILNTNNLHQNWRHARGRSTRSPTWGPCGWRRNFGSPESLGFSLNTSSREAVSSTSSSPASATSKVTWSIATASLKSSRTWLVYEYENHGSMIIYLDLSFDHPAKSMLYFCDPIMRHMMNKAAMKQLTVNGSCIECNAPTLKEW